MSETVHQGGRGRPHRGDNFGWEELMKLPVNACVLVRTHSSPRTVIGRIVETTEDSVVLYTLVPVAYRKISWGSPWHHRVTRSSFAHARLMEGLWSHHLDRRDGLSQLEGYPDAPGHYDRPDHIVYKRGVPETEWRGILLDQRGQRVKVLRDEVTGEFEWLDEREIEDEWMRTQAGMIPGKPGRHAKDPETERINESEWGRRWSAWFDEWAE